MTPKITRQVAEKIAADYRKEVAKFEHFAEISSFQIAISQNGPLEVCLGACYSELPFADELIDFLTDLGDRMKKRYSGHLTYCGICGFAGGKDFMYF